jgi:NADPH:quinone reductase-like Zn-dependent oxidoreductase
MSTHTAIAATSKCVISAIQMPTDDPGEGEVLLRVAYSSLIALDTYIVDLAYHVDKFPKLLGLNASGTVAKVGEGVHDLQVGDRVTAFAFQGSRSRPMQEYSILSHTVCSKIPNSLSLPSAATIPDNFVTAFYTLFDQLPLPVPTSLPSAVPSPLADTPILIYGAGSTAGQYAIQILRLAGYKQIIATASSKHHDYLKALGATHTFDYNSATLTEEIESVLGGYRKVPLVLDCITAAGTLAAIAKVISPEGTIALLLPIKEGNSVRGPLGTEMYMELPERLNPFPSSVQVVGVQTFRYQENEYLKENLMTKILPALLASGFIQPNRVRLLDETQGTFKERVEVGLDLLRNNKVSGEKVIVKLD